MKSCSVPLRENKHEYPQEGYEKKKLFIKGEEGFIDGYNQIIIWIEKIKGQGLYRNKD